MTDDTSLFRRKIDTVQQEEPHLKSTDSARATTPEVDVPYLDYSRVHSHPYPVDYFNLGDTWDDPSGGFPKEISLIETYFENKIKNGEIANSITAIQEEIKRMEKMTNVKEEERPLIKIETLAAYVKFLMETDRIKFNLRRYANP